MLAEVAEASPFAQAAAELISLGYHPVPIVPPGVDHPGAGKAPGEFRGGWRGMGSWQRFRDRTLSPFERQIWERWPSANIGLVMGTPAGEFKLIAIDIDAEDADALDDLVRCLPATPMRKKGKKGETRFYRAAPSIKTKSYNNADKVRLVDLLTGYDTRQTVCPPSVHPSGCTYQWLQGPVAPADLPVFDDDALERLEDTLRALGWDPDAQRPSKPVESAPPDEDDYFSETKAAALANMDAWVPALDLYNTRRARGGYEAVATWRASSTGQPTEKRKRNLSIQRNGIKDFGTGDTYSAIDLVMAAKGCSQEASTAWLRSQLGLSGEIIFMPTPAPLAEPQPKELSSNLNSTEAPQPTELPDALTRVPGLLGELTDWICDTARRPQRALSLGAALTVLGTAGGRKYGGPTRSGTHLYVLGLARSGAGKDHALSQIATLLTAANMTSHLGPGSFMSISAVVNRIARAPLTLSAMDEFASFIAKVNNKRGSTHEQAISGMLRTLWSASFKTVSPPEWANRAPEPIHAPALSIYGVATPDEFYAALSGADITNGFLNRFLLLSTRKRPAERDPKKDPFEVPTSIREGLHRLYGSGSALSNATAHSGRADGPAISATWDNDEALKIYRDFGRMIEDREAEAAFLARTAESAIRLATIYAMGVRHDAPRITVEAMTWARDVALWSSERMIAETADHLAETANQAEAQRIIRLLKERGRMKHGDLLYAMKNRLRAKDFKEIMAGLIEAGQVRCDVERPERGGTETRWYQAS